MQVSVNGKAGDTLPAAFEREARAGGPREQVEGEVLSADAAVAAAMLGLTFRMAFIGSLVALIVTPLVVGFALTNPGELLVVGPVALATVVATALLIRHGYDRDSRRLRERAGAPSPGALAAGASVRVVASGLSNGDRTSTDLIERPELDGGAGPFTLDAFPITNGRLLLHDVWKRCAARTLHSRLGSVSKIGGPIGGEAK